MNLDCIEMRLLKKKLFDLLSNRDPNIALQAAGLLKDIQQIEGVPPPME